MHQLKNPYPTVQGQSCSFYGGCQNASGQKTLRRCGCGLVCGTDLLLYLHRFRPGCATSFFVAAGSDPLEQAEYERLLTQVRRRWLPIVYPLGTSGPALAWGLNRYFDRYGLKLRAEWPVKWQQLWDKTAEMLQNDLPVILAVGQNFPLPWAQHRLTFYTRTAEGEFRPACAAKAHFVNVTAMEGRWLRVASWGRSYWLDRQEYERYALQHSCRRFCGIVYIHSYNQKENSI